MSDTFLCPHSFTLRDFVEYHQLQLGWLGLLVLTTMLLRATEKGANNTILSQLLHEHCSVSGDTKTNTIYSLASFFFNS